MMIKSGRGSVGRSFSAQKRWKEDKEYRENKIKGKQENASKHVEKRREQQRIFIKDLNEFRNRKCEKCGRLLNFRTKYNYCKEHMVIGREKRKKYQGMCLAIMKTALVNKVDYRDVLRYWVMMFEESRVVGWDRNEFLDCMIICRKEVAQ